MGHFPALLKTFQTFNIIKLKRRIHISFNSCTHTFSKDSVVSWSICFRGSWKVKP